MCKRVLTKVGWCFLATALNSACFVLAQDTIPLPPVAEIQASTLEIPVEVRFSSVVPTQDFIDMPVVDANGRQLGKVSDLLIDLQSGAVPLAMVRQQGSIGAGQIVVPLACGTFLRNDSGQVEWKLAAPAVSRLRAQSGLTRPPRTRQEASQWCEKFGVSLPRLHASQTAEEWQLTSLRLLADQRIESPIGGYVGRVKEFVVDLSTQLVAYTLLAIPNPAATSPNTPPEQILVPLSAYRKSSREHVWILEIPIAQLRQMERVPSGTFPLSIPAYWVEHLTEELGTDFYGGVQSLVQQTPNTQARRTEFTVP
ncbi:PRC-barrel domain-containing protein [Planctomicrobium sp. SH664]|uniref:PRC-barrel domain-containing protein n=1 Tax=Planctomicrobium sp. SH664 TaxID=3448125 RepID=UPI003F5B773C